MRDNRLNAFSIGVEAALLSQRWVAANAFSKIGIERNRVSSRKLGV